MTLGDDEVLRVANTNIFYVFSIKNMCLYRGKINKHTKHVCVYMAEGGIKAEI